ncbi:hypothetical protein EMCRGX_G016547, partial [Ephydatia muelleri]
DERNSFVQQFLFVHNLETLRIRTLLFLVQTLIELHDHQRHRGIPNNNVHILSQTTPSQATNNLSQRSQPSSHHPKQHTHHYHKPHNPKQRIVSHKALDHHPFLPKKKKGTG